MLYLFWNTIRLLLFGIHLIALPAFLSKHHLADLRNKLFIFMNKGQLNKLIRTITLYQKEYRKIRHLAHHLNWHFVSPYLLVSFACHAIVSCLTVALLLGQRIALRERTLLTIFVLVQFLMLILGVELMVYVSAIFNSGSGGFYKVQLILSNLRHKSIICFKYKLLGLYELINSKNRFYFTMGPLGRVSHYALLKVCTI